MTNLLKLEKHGVTVGLDLDRGGCVGSIIHPLTGELVVNDMDGRGIGTSGILVTPPPNRIIPCECGSHLGTGNSQTAKFSTSDRILASCQRTKNWDTGEWADEMARRIGMDINVDITHDARILNQSTVVIREWIHNRSKTQNLRIYDNNGYRFPIAPQLHLVPADSWSYLYRDKWREFDMDPRQGPGWLDRQFDLYRNDIEAVAVYYRNGSGVGIRIGDIGRAWYLKTMSTVTFIGNVWDFPKNGLKAGETRNREMRLVIGTRATIESKI